MPSWPTGVQTTTITFGKGITVDGNVTSATLTVTPIFSGTKAVKWATDSTPLLPFVVTATADAGAYGSVQIPVVDQAGWKDDGQHDYSLWAYKLEELPKYGTTVGAVRTKYVQPITGQAVIDFDDISDGSVGLPASAPVVPVSDVAGLTGSVSLAALQGLGLGGATDASVEAIVANPSSATAAALAATYSPLVPFRQVPPLASISKPIMAAPPTVTANLTATTIGGTTVDWPVAVPSPGSEVAGSILAYGGAGFTMSDPGFINSLIDESPYDHGVIWYEWVTDAPIVEFVYCGIGPSDFRLEVDGQRTQDGDYTFTSGGGAVRRIAIDFGSRAIRHVKLSTFVGVPALRLTTGIADTLYAPAGGKRLRSFWLMDSYGGGNQESLQYVASELLGIENVMRSAVGGTGYTHANGSYPPFASSDRLAVAAASKADLVVIAGGINDQDTTGLATACDTVYSSIKASLPNAQIVVVGPWMPSTGTQSSKAAIRDTIHDRATAAGLPFIDTSGWFTGNGNAGAPNGSGNADTLISPDGTHPVNPIGQQYLGVRLAGEIAKVWKQPGTTGNR